METGSRVGLAFGLVGTAIAGILYAFRKRAVSADSWTDIESFQLGTGPQPDLNPVDVTAQKIAPPLEEISVTARKISSETVAPAPAAFTRTTRGLRNYNPGNIRWIVNPKSRWRGMIRDDGTGYGVFDSDANGIRAIGKQLGVYARRGLVTVRQIISTWAPPTENATLAYVDAVARRLRVSPDATIDVQTRLVDLANAIIHHENGRNPYAPADVAKWVRLP